MISLDKEPSDQELIAYAMEGQKRAYAPYSKYLVGSALYIKQENKHYIFHGCNVENASYSVSICSERAAMCSAISAGFIYGFKSIAIVTKDGLATSCGTCRQFMNEFNPNMKIILATHQGEMRVKPVSLDKLLPEAFGPHNLV